MDQIMNRRSALKYIAAIGIGGGGVYAWQNVDRHKKSVIESASSIVGPPPTENEIATKSPKHKSGINSVTFFESGATEITLEENHNGESVGFAHEYHDMGTERVAKWNAPEFSGPITVDLKSEIAAHGEFPTNSFQLAIISHVKNDVYLMISSSFRFSVPDSYIG